MENEAAERLREIAERAAREILSSVSGTQYDWAQIYANEGHSDFQQGADALDKITAIITKHESSKITLLQAEVERLRAAQKHEFEGINDPNREATCAKCGITVLEDHDGVDCVGHLREQVARLRAEVGGVWKEAIRIANIDASEMEHPFDAVDAIVTALRARAQPEEKSK